MIRHFDLLVSKRSGVAVLNSIMMLRISTTIMTTPPKIPIQAPLLREFIVILWSVGVFWCLDIGRLACDGI